jgi:hypothetical protein
MGEEGEGKSKLGMEGSGESEKGRKVRARISCGISSAWAVDGWKSWPDVGGLDLMRKRQRKRKGKCGRKGGKLGSREGARGAMCNKS